jgi:hypothetical protein
VTDFWARVDRSGGDDACWPWTGRLGGEGYGECHAKVDGSWRTLLTHRRAYTLAKGDPGPLCVLHTCDNRPCCNPRHLWLGTRGDNNRDMHEKRRNRQPRGELVANAKLTDRQVLAIRTLYATGSTVRELALLYPIGAAELGDVVGGKSFAHLPGAHARRKARAHLSHDDVLEVLRSGESSSVLAQRFATNARNIRNCRAGRTYGNVAAEVLDAE